MAISFTRPDPASPASVSAAQFPTSRKGYDQAEVRDFLRMVAAEQARLQERERFLERELKTAEQAKSTSMESIDEDTATRLLGEEAARVLQTAREAATQIRLRAEESAARLLREATDEAQRLRQEAEIEVARRRQDAAADAEAELSMAKQQGRDMVNEARAYRERVLSELGRRRELARHQIEQLIHGRDRLLQAFERSRIAAVEVMNELTPLEEPDEYVNLQPTTGPVPMMVPAGAGSGVSDLVALVAEADEVLDDTSFTGVITARIETITTEVVTETTTVVVPMYDVDDETEGADEVDGLVSGDSRSRSDETDRAPDRGDEAGDAGADGDADDLGVDGELGDDDGIAADEHAETRPDLRIVADLDVSEHDGDDGDDDDGRPVGMVSSGDAESGDAKPAPDAELESDSDTDTQTEAEIVQLFAGEIDDPAPKAVGATVEDLFARLRAARTDAVAHAVETTVDTPTATSVDASADLGPIADTHAADGSTTETDDETDDEAAEQNIDEVLVPLVVSAARRLKRVLADEQNDLLDTLRRKEPIRSLDVLLPWEADQSARYVAAVEDDLLASASAGAQGGENGRNPAIIRPAVDAVTNEIVAPLRDRLIRCIDKADGDNVELGNQVRTLYREWKTHRIDEHVENIVRLAFDRGALTIASR